jgi:hypothetical protein
VQGFTLHTSKVPGSLSSLQDLILFNDIFFGSRRISSMVMHRRDLITGSKKRSYHECGSLRSRPLQSVRGHRYSRQDSRWLSSTLDKAIQHQDFVLVGRPARCWFSYESVVSSVPTLRHAPLAIRSLDFVHTHPRLLFHYSVRRFMLHHPGVRVERQIRSSTSSYRSRDGDAHPLIQNDKLSISTISFGFFSALTSSICLTRL